LFDLLAKPTAGRQDGRVSSAPDPGQFEVHRAEVREGVEIAYLREGEGPALVLLHGWPETKRIYWRNVAPLAAAGFEVIVPDLRGFGDSGLAPDGFYDVAAHSRDLEALVRGVLGHRRCFLAGGDLGGAVVQDMALRFEGFVPRQAIFNTLLPVLPEAYAAAGIEIRPGPPDPGSGDYYLRQGHEADTLLAELDTPERRRRYVGEFYGHRFWGARGAFTRAEVDFMTEPFADAAKLRAGWANYEGAVHAIPRSERPRLAERSAVPTLALWGPEDHVVQDTFPAQCEVAFERLAGPFTVPGAGHFLPWERAHLFNGALEHFFKGPPA
jgi:pimeloyl-ACP methyl ester carboxylesterase